MMRVNKKLISSIKNPYLLNIPFQNFSELQGNFFKFSRNLENKELKFPFDGSSYSIFFDRNDKLSDISKRILGTTEKLQKVEFLDFSNEIIKDENLLFTNVFQNPFRIRINGHVNVKYIPSISMVIKDETSLLFDENGIYSELNLLLIESTKVLIAGKDIKESHKILNEKKVSIQSKLDSLLTQYEKLSTEYSKGEEFIDKRLKYHRILLCNAVLIFFLLHAFIFYWLIYQIYGWDTIEPITYIVGNLYWIIGLSFFVFKKKKLEFNFIFSSSYHKEFYKKIGERIGYCKTEKQFILKEIQDVKKFKQILSKI